MRKILGIPHSFYSRVSNERVRVQSGMTMFSSSVRKLQLKLLGQVVNDPRKQILKEVTFHGDTLDTETSAYVRRVGRPRQNWTDQLISIMRQAAGTYEVWMQAVSSAEVWREVSSRAVL